MSDGIGFRVDVNADSVLSVLRSLVRAGKDIRPALAQIGDAWLDRVDLEFRTSTDPYGRPWAELAVRDGQPLRDTGRLSASFDKRVEPLSLVVGTNVEYAPTHQLGATIRALAHPYLTFRTDQGWVSKKEVTVPARPMLPAEGLPHEWAQDAVDIVSDYLRQVGR